MCKTPFPVSGSTAAARIIAGAVERFLANRLIFSMRSEDSPMRAS